jgi:serine/threonine kinase PknH
LDLEPLAPGDPLRIASYRLQGRLGAGGMGQVYLALTPGGRLVALKVMHPHLAGDRAFRTRFEREVTAARRVHGMYTALVLDADPAATPPWLATAYVPGPSLRETVTRHGPMPVRTVQILAASVAEALQVIHAAGLVHRDLKPSNVLLAPDGPRVIDFGIARAAEDAELTGSGIRIGSPHYMAPEQVAGQPVSGATDVFALGALIVYAATGRPAFGAGPDLSVLYRVRYEPADLAGCPDELRPLAGWCLAKDPAARPAPGEVVTWCHSRLAGWTGQIVRPWLPPRVTREMPGPAGSGTVPLPPPAAARPAPPAAARPAPPGHMPGGPPRPPRPRRRRRPGAVLLALIAAVVAAGWLAGHVSAMTPQAPAPGPAAPRGAWLSGRWTGPARQPAGKVTHWTAELSFSPSGGSGTFRFPALGCSGTLTMLRTTRRTAAARQDMTANSRHLCVPGGLIVLSRGPAGHMAMTWQDPTDSRNRATARLRHHG